jgi:tetratricopeptide (TPR) repeat protein
MSARVCGLLALVLIACSKHLPAAFSAAEADAERAYRSENYRAAAEQWRRAAELAPDARERDEAVYRRAEALQRAGEHDAADAVYRSLEQGHGERAERAAFERADNALARDDRPAALVLLRAAIARFPNSGLSQLAVHKTLDLLAETEGEPAQLEELDRLLTQAANTELAESLLFLRARWLEQHGESERAMSEYRSLVRRFPYPHGKYWDDALLGCARLDEARGDYRAAITDLESMLAERETARTMGSYERPSFAEARYRIAELYRDRLKQPGRAREEFRRVWSDHPTSRLRDDALFEEALIALHSNDRAGACAPARLLAEKEPDSRFAACAPRLCPALRVTGQCRAYLEARISQAAEPADFAAGSANPPHSSSSR